MRRAAGRISEKAATPAQISLAWMLHSTTSSCPSPDSASSNASRKASAPQTSTSPTASSRASRPDWPVSRSTATAQTGDLADAVAMCPQRRGRAVRDADRGEDLGHVRLDGLLGDAQAAGDLLVRQAARDESQDV